MDSYVLLENTEWILFHTKGDKPKSYIDVLYDYISKYNSEKEHIWEPFIYKFYKDDYKPLGYAINNDNGLYLLTNLYDKGDALFEYINSIIHFDKNKVSRLNIIDLNPNIIANNYLKIITNFKNI